MGKLRILRAKKINFQFQSTVDDNFERLCSCHVGIIFISHCWKSGGREREYLIHWGLYTITGLGGDFIKLSACHSSLNIEIGKLERLINFMDILCLSVYFEDGRNLKLYLLCRVSSINSLVSMPRPAIHTTGNMIDLNK